MQIDNTYLTNRTIGQPDPSVAASAGRPPIAAPPAAASSHVPSPELLDLLARVRQAPSVREAVLAQVAQRLQSGYYLNRAAAEQAADAIQKAQE